MKRPLILFAALALGSAAPAHAADGVTLVRFHARWPYGATERIFP